MKSTLLQIATILTLAAPLQADTTTQPATQAATQPAVKPTPPGTPTGPKENTSDQAGEWYTQWGFYATVAGLLVGIGCAAIAVIQIKNRRRKIPQRYISSSSLLPNVRHQVKKVQVLYDGTPIDRLSLAIVEFWNAGKEVIYFRDLSKTHPLRIILSDGMILGEPQVTEISGENVEFDATLNEDNPDEILLTFESLAKNEGARITFHHTAEDNSSISLAGRIPGTNFPRSRQQDAATLTANQRRTRNMALISILLCTIPMFILMLSSGPFSTWQFSIVMLLPVFAFMLLTAFSDMFLELPSVVRRLPLDSQSRNTDSK
ncbi:MAG: hypothetical protein QGG42_07970 [Phycisphaerae bacterium]|jgi:hypothetical protein|nr:hypothetical protein [Phycisphaerae bacterium]